MPTNMTRWALSHITVIFIAIAVLSLTLVACGSDDDADVGGSVASAGDSVSGSDAGSIADSTVDESNAEVPPALVAASEPEAGSIEETILTLKERQIELQRSGDWQALMDTCAPELTESLTIERFKTGYEVGLNTIGVSDFKTLNMRNASVTVYGGKTAILTADAFDGDTPGSAGISTTYTNIDGKWYDESLLCKGLKYG
ncbi:MAG: hypothetical protein IH960_03035 [Chloroflexi bacterium]|nr:hypothetical protein [Chloroflexota bacterium]